MGALGLGEEEVVHEIEMSKHDCQHAPPRPFNEVDAPRLAGWGRLAASGSSLRVDSARAEQKPPIPSTVVACSAPPAIMISASP